MTKDELIKYVKRQLGYPVVNIEITDEQIDDAITSAVDEIKPWYTTFRYLTLDINGGKGSIDLTQYKVMDVTDVLKVTTFGAGNGSGSMSDPFSYDAAGMMIYPMYETMNYNFSIMDKQGIHTIISNYARLYQEQFYSKLAYLVQQRTMGMLTENISWKYYDNILYVDTGYPSTTIITIEYIPKLVVVEDIEENSRYTRYLQDLSVAFALITQARITGKYNVSGAPVTVNYSDMRADANSDIERIRKELQETANLFYITD